jgi:hypothetical protein
MRFLEIEYNGTIKWPIVTNNLANNRDVEEQVRKGF